MSELLGKYCTVVRGSSPRPKGDPRYYGEGVPRLMVADLTRDGKCVTPRIDSLTLEGAKKSRAMQKGDIVIAVSGNPGLPGILEIDACIHDGFVGLRDLDPKFSADYVYRFLVSFHAEVKTQAVGAIYKNLTTTQIKKLKIPLPPLAEQKRIAGILDAADALRAKRRESLARLDTLLQSTFLDLFGDPVTNPMGWEVDSLNSNVKIEHGFAFKSEYFARSGRYILLTPGSFKEAGGFKDQGAKTKYFTAEPPSKFVLPVGALLVAMTEQAPGLLGSPIFVPKSDLYLHNQRLGRIHLSERLHPEFVYHLFNTAWVRGEIQRTSTGTKVKHTSPTKIGAIPIPLPPLALQQQFAGIVESVERQKARQRAHLAELDTLFASLQARAFQGEI